MRLKAVSVSGLFGTFDHEIPMDHTDGLTIIHGPNGFGKTVMLRMIAGALRGESRIFSQFPFAEFKLTFDDGSTWTIKPGKLEEAKKSGTPNLVVTTIAADGKQSRVDLKAKEPTAAVLRSLDVIDRSVPPPYSRPGASIESGARQRNCPMTKNHVNQHQVALPRGV